jgi:hypothetical protein
LMRAKICQSCIGRSKTLARPWGRTRHTHLSRAANASPSADKAQLPEKVGLHVQPVNTGAFFRGVTCAVPPLEIETEIERRLFKAGKTRKRCATRSWKETEIST